MTINKPHHPITGKPRLMPGYFARLCRKCGRQDMAHKFRKVKGLWKCEECRCTTA